MHVKQKKFQMKFLVISSYSWRYILTHIHTATHTSHTCTHMCDWSPDLLPPEPIT